MLLHDHTSGAAGLCAYMSMQNTVGIGIRCIELYACEPIFYLASFKLNTTSVLKVIQFYVWDESNFLKFN